jgi:hypothetical protein
MNKHTHVRTKYVHIFHPKKVYQDVHIAREMPTFGGMTPWKGMGEVEMFDNVPNTMKYNMNSDEEQDYDVMSEEEFEDLKNDYMKTMR